MPATKTTPCAKTSAHPGKTGLFVLDRGEDSLLARLWMIERASRTVDAQYFIWTADNVGILASEALLRAAEPGVRARVIVDDRGPRIVGRVGQLHGGDEGLFGGPGAEGEGGQRERKTGESAGRHDRG